MKITVFTPTYNRAYTIETLYHSLQRQNFNDFEWLVVDDGSTDNTEELFNKWQQEDNPFSIRYYKKENGGKCSAINYALDLACGKLFFTVDSDDYLTDDALDKIARWEAELPAEVKYCGLAGNLGISPDATPNHRFEGDFFDGTLLDRYKQVDGERASVFYTDVHKKYRYPLFPGEKFMTEAVVWNRMAHDGYKMRYYNDIIWIYEYKEDGLTKAGAEIFLKNPHGYGLWLREKAQFEKKNFVSRLKMYYTFTCDLSGRIANCEIAKCIRVPYWLVVTIQFIHSLINKMK